MIKKWICALLAMLLLCGCAAPGSGETEEQTRPQAQTTLPEDPEALLQWRRDTAEAYMRHMMSALWQTDTPILYSTYVNSLGPEMDEESRRVYLEPGKVYSGMPYTHGNGNADRFYGYGEPDENGIYQLKGMDSELLSGGGGTKMYNRARIGNDCADAVAWAWARIGNSFTFNTTQNMTKSRGCLPVGEYKTQDDTYKKTKDIVLENGNEVMYKAYACLQKADGVVTYNGSGHAMMISQVHVEQVGGVIDPEASYVLVLEQSTSNYKNGVTYVDEATGQVVYRLGGVDNKYTFARLFKSGYLPVTIRELVDPAPVEAPVLIDSVEKPDGSNITSGSISCMTIISTVTATITDAQGNVIQQATCFPKSTEQHMFRMENFDDFNEWPVTKGQLDVKSLTPGSYHCTVDCTLGNGDVLTARDFDFTVGG